MGWCTGAWRNQRTSGHAHVGKPFGFMGGRGHTGVLGKSSFTASFILPGNGLEPGGEPLLWISVAHKPLWFVDLHLLLGRDARFVEHLRSGTQHAGGAQSD